MPVAKTQSLLQKIAAASAAMENPAKRADNPHFKSKFANLADTMDVIEPELDKQGLGHVFVFQGTSLVYRVFDPNTNEAVESSLDIGTLMEGLSGNVWQQMGQSFTYLRRYLSQAFWNLVPEDDDAQSAPSRPAAARQPARTQSQMETPAGENDDLY